MSDNNVYYEEQEEMGLDQEGVTRTGGLRPASHSFDSWPKSYQTFTVSENGSPKGKQWEHVEGATARLINAHYHYLPDAPDQHGQAKLFHYYPPMLASLQATEGASKSSIGKVLGMAKKKAGPELVHSEFLNPYSLKNVKGAVKRGDVKSPLNDYRGQRTPLSEYEESVNIDYDESVHEKAVDLEYEGEDMSVSTERAENEVMRDMREDGVDAARSAILSAQRTNDHPDKYTGPNASSELKSRIVPTAEVNQNVRDAIAMRDPDRSYSALAVDQAAATAEYNKIQNDNKNDVDLFGNPTVTRKLYKQGE
jgi:hypothetical protein